MNGQAIKMDEQLASLLAAASQAQRTGQFEQAEKMCNQILQADPSQVDAWNLLAMVHFRSGRHASAEWRWLLDREDSPWYPTMRLFRQRRRGDWNDVFARIAVALADRR